MFEYFIPANYSIESKTDIRSIYTYMKLDIGNNCRKKSKLLQILLHECRQPQTVPYKQV